MTLEAPPTSISDRYLNLLMKTLVRFDGTPNYEEEDFAQHARGLKKIVADQVKRNITDKGLKVVREVPFDAELRRVGRDLPQFADSMIGIKRMENIRDAVKTVIAENIPGDIVETGVWRGGASILARAALDAYGDASRTVWCCDSFEGLPAPEINRYPQDVGAVWHTRPELAVAIEDVKRNFQKYGYLDDRVRFVKGWFKDTLGSLPVSEISILRLDGDMYSSTMDALRPLYDKVSTGGFIIVDDYGIPMPECKQAITDFRNERAISDPIIDIDGWGAYWRKGAR